jgi:hypothetical protein
VAVEIRAPPRLGNPVLPEVWRASLGLSKADIGNSMGGATTTVQRAQQALHLVPADPRRAIDLAADVALDADREGDNAASAVAARAD